jgi:hypothetical protein
VSTTWREGGQRTERGDRPADWPRKRLRSSKGRFRGSRHLADGVDLMVEALLQRESSQSVSTQPSAPTSEPSMPPSVHDIAPRMVPTFPHCCTRCHLNPKLEG